MEIKKSKRNRGKKRVSKETRYNRIRSHVRRYSNQQYKTLTKKNTNKMHIKGYICNTLTVNLYQL